MNQIVTQIYLTLYIIFSSAYSGQKYDPKNGYLPIYTTDPAKPFRYGIPYSAEESFRVAENLIRDYEIEDGDTIADIGAASGYIEGAISVKTENVIFYIQDIDVAYLNDKELNKVNSYFSAFRKSPQSNKFIAIIGTTQKTKLPDVLFDKIILRFSFHNFMYGFDMLQDICKRVKPGGKIYLTDYFIEQDVPYTATYKTKLYSLRYTRSIMKAYGFYLTHMKVTPSCFENTLVFEKDKEKSENYKRANTEVEKKIISLGDFTIAGDSLQTNNIAGFLMADSIKSQLLDEYEMWIIYTGAQYKSVKNYEASIHVLQVGTKLFPESPLMYLFLGEAYFGLKKYEEAKSMLHKSLELGPENMRAIELLVKIDDKEKN